MRRRRRDRPRAEWGLVGRRRPGEPCRARDRRSLAATPACGRGGPRGRSTGAGVVAPGRAGNQYRPAVGQTVSTEWAPDGELVVTDVTGQYRLPRGSVMLVRRNGRNASVYGRSIQFVLPGELLTEDDIAFLEGHASAPRPVEAPAPDLPLSLEVTTEVQAQLLSDATRTTVRTADFLFPYVGIAGFALLGS